MISLEWLSTFAAIYRAGSVSDAARQRRITQSAMSQQLSGLEAVVGVRLFDRTSRGMIPTERGKALYLEIFEAVDCLDRVGQSILRSSSPSRSIRFGTSPEYFHGFALQRIGGLGLSLSVTLASDRELLEGLHTGGLDLVATLTKPTSRSIQFQVVGEESFTLIGPGTCELPPAESSLPDLGGWLNAKPWVSYSEERPITRRFWQQSLNARFAAKSALVVPDILTVVAAVELGIGLSIVPNYLCKEALDKGRIQEIWSITDLIPPERRYACFRRTDADRSDVATICDALKRADLPHDLSSP